MKDSRLNLDLTATVPSEEMEILSLPGSQNQDPRLKILSSILKTLRESDCVYLAGPSLKLTEGICFVIIDGERFHLGHGFTLLSAANKAYTKWERENFNG